MQRRPSGRTDCTSILGVDDKVPAPDSRVEPAGQSGDALGPFLTQDCGFWTPSYCSERTTVQDDADLMELRIGSIATKARLS